ncbi:CDP-glycerol glycerophosphotransferase family protein, partial [Patescibacteria group bacterium]|nr:CDP-glycerol glycerophosphotransferase family protein [Patescibacteria group bacterium]
VKQYAISMHSYPEERIFISGLPQLDVYVTNNRIRTRDQFLSSLGIDPKALLIVYSAVGKLISYHEPEVIQYLSELIGSGGVVKDAHLLVRLHPAYPSDEGLLKELPNTTIIRPGRVGVDDNPLRFDFEFDSEETTALMETLKWADVLIQSGSTMAIDAACFDTPIISLGFDGYIENEKLEFSNRRLLIKDHYQRILDTGGTKEVYTEKELISAIQEYIRHPEADKAGRARIVDEQCYRLDGKSGRRVGEYILTYLQQISA